MTTQAPGPPPRSRGAGLTRRTDDRVVAGVASGVARWLGVDPLVCRLGFAVLAVSGGVGVALYAVLWAALPEDGAGGPGRRAAVDTGERAQRAAALGLLLVGGLLLLREAGWWLGDAVVWPVVLAAVGLALMWPETAGQTARRAESMLGSRQALVRVGAGVVAVVAGIAVFAVANTSLRALQDTLLAFALAAGGLVLIFGPWGWRVGRDLVEERRARIRSDERAEVAAQLHDSVLQTLALIQQRAGAADPEIAQLARRQERELRAWLFGDPKTGAASLAGALRGVSAEVEDLFPVTVDAVVVGDCPLDERVEALVGAVKEALVNAAKFSGERSVSLYAEVEPAAVTAFVRDRGDGFDPASVPTDRRGISESIRGRMARHGGRGVVTSAPGDGTEVEVRLPRRER